MKLLFILFLIAVIGTILYFFSSQKVLHTAGVVVILLGFVAYGIYTSATALDTQCTTLHKTNSQPPSNLKTAVDYFLLGNYDYDTGNCGQAITNYTRTISLNPNYKEAYNNRAYTYMRMQDYNYALPDLDKAIQRDPNYVQALMNRGDIHNYYYAIDKAAAIVDYRKVIALGAVKNTSVCGHLFLAKHNGWNIGTVVGLFSGESMTCQ